MDHRAAIAAIPPERRRVLTAQSDRPGLVRLALHLGLMLAMVLWIGAGVPGWPIALIAAAVLLTFLFAPLHEAIHRTAFRNDLFNRVVAHICGALLLLTPAHFRYFHFAHHRFTQDPDHDPELAVPKPDTLAGHLTYLTGLPEWAGRMNGLLAQARGNLQHYVPDRGRARVVRQARLYLALYIGLAVASIGAGSTLLLWVWILPNLLGQPLMRAYLLAEHARCPQISNMLANTRTTFSTRLVRWLAWNMPFHIEHHTYPAVPFHQLPALHNEIAEALITTSEGYVRFNADYLRDLATTTRPRASAP